MIRRLGLSLSCGAMLSMVLLTCGITAAPADSRVVKSSEITGQACIALAVFSVARGASFLEQAAVVTVIRNQMARVGVLASPCDVIYAMPEFAELRRWPFPRAPWEMDQPGWHMALDVTDAVMTGDYDVGLSACARATSFHRADVAPMQEGRRFLRPDDCLIGSHVFFFDTAAIAGTD